MGPWAPQAENSVAQTLPSIGLSMYNFKNLLSQPSFNPNPNLN